MRELERLLVARIAADGAMSFDEFQANALYARDLGFYTGGGGAGRRRDFLTSPEVGPLFGAVLARALDSWWDGLGQPERFVVVEAGAGPGTLARSILAASPRCADALDLVLVEVGEPQWATHPDGVTTVLDLPQPGSLGPGPVIVLANELLDNLPVALVERTADGWEEVVVVVTTEGLDWSRRPLAAPQVVWCERHLPDAPVGARAPIQAEAAAWVRAARELAVGGRVVVFDYARSTADLVALPMEQWLRTYASHGRAGRPLEDPGSRDITCDVALDQLALVAEPTAVRTQADFLQAHGIEDLVAEGRAIWDELGVAGGLRAIAAHSRATEADALGDPDGLGAFTVMEWT